MDTSLKENYTKILQSELIPALGCTEPIAIAYAAARAREVLGEFPKRVELCLSGNIIKNVKGVTVPNSNGMKGIDVAAVLGIVGGNSKKQLKVLDEITDKDIAKAKELLSTDYFTCKLQKGVENLYIVATVFSEKHNASVTIVNRHTLITKITYDEKILYQADYAEVRAGGIDKSALTIRDIIAYAESVELHQVENLIRQQIEMNTAIAREGLSNQYGPQIGRTILECNEGSVATRAKAYAAAGSDARMGGCALPVVINSGSGNQGITVCLPVIEYARKLHVTKEKLYRALIISNLTAIHQKHYIGSLSAFCGAVTAACGAGAAITYLHGGSYEQICRTITNTLANVGGIICDGAKASCAAKIASAVDAAILAHNLSMKERGFSAGEGIVQGTIEKTMKSFGYLGKVGMEKTDVEILNIMIDKVHFNDV